MEKKKPGCIHKVRLRVWLREAHFVGTPKFYCCYLSWLVVTIPNFYHCNDRITK